MTFPKFGKLLLASAFTLAVLAPVAQAEPIAGFTSVLTGSSPTQLGRPSRSGTPQNWAGDEAYTGVIGSANTYSYTTFTFAASQFTGAPFVEVGFYDELQGFNLFITAYANSYNNASRGTNWLGDEGFSGPYAYNDPTFFDVVLPTSASLVLVVNNTVPGGGGVNAPFDITVDAFGSTQYDPPVPEPSTLVMLSTGLLGLAGAARRRFTNRR